MKVVVDVNRVIAALLKDSTTRSIFFRNHTFLTPENALESLKKYSKEIAKRSRLSVNELNVVQSLLFEQITIVPKKDYKSSMKTAAKLVQDEEDVPFLALALASHADAIWTHNEKHFKQDKVRIVTNIHLLK